MLFFVLGNNAIIATHLYLTVVVYMFLYASLLFHVVLLLLEL